MEKFVLAGKAKTVFQIIELMEKGEELDNKKKLTQRKMENDNIIQFLNTNQFCIDYDS